QAKRGDQHRSTHGQSDGLACSLRYRTLSRFVVGLQTIYGGSSTAVWVWCQGERYRVASSRTPGISRTVPFSLLIPFSCPSASVHPLAPHGRYVKMRYREKAPRGHSGQRAREEQGPFFRAAPALSQN